MLRKIFYVLRFPEFWITLFGLLFLGYSVIWPRRKTIAAYYLVSGIGNTSKITLL